MAEQCIFCGIAGGGTDTELVAVSEHTVAFKDIHPKAPVHLLVVPKAHLSSLKEAQEGEQALLGEMMLLARKAAREAGIAETGYKLAMNVGKGAGQIVDHIHFHVLGGWQEKPQGISV